MKKNKQSLASNVFFGFGALICTPLAWAQAPNGGEQSLATPIGTAQGKVVALSPDPAESSAGPTQMKSFTDDPLHMLAESLSSAPNLGEATRNIVLTNAQHGDFLPAISWALAQGYWGLAQLLIQNNPKPTPAWARLSLALHRHDLPEMQRLLAHPERLPVRDRLQAQLDLGQYFPGRRDALAAMEVDPYDRRLRREYLQAVRESASYLDSAGVWENFNGLTLTGPSVHGRIALGNAWGIRLSVDALHQSAATSAQLLAVPAWSVRELLGLYWHSPQGKIQGEVGNYQGLRSNISLQLKARWQLSNSTELAAGARYHDRSTQSAVMAVAGMTNGFQVQGTKQIGAWTASMGAGWRQYQGQDGYDLGSDTFVESSVLWRQGLGPWELQMGPFVDYHAMARSGDLQGVVRQTLAPAVRTIDTVLPGSYTDFGARLQWGQMEPAIASDWTPYVALSVYDNTRFGLQYQLNAGLSTPVFGPDRFRIGFAQGQGGNGLAINQRMVEMGYRYYF